MCNHMALVLVIINEREPFLPDLCNNSAIYVVTRYKEDIICYNISESQINLYI